MRNRSPKCGIAVRAGDPGGKIIASPSSHALKLVRLQNPAASSRALLNRCMVNSAAVPDLRTWTRVIFIRFMDNSAAVHGCISSSNIARVDNGFDIANSNNSALDLAVRSSELGAREQRISGPALVRTGSPADDVIVHIGGN